MRCSNCGQKIKKRSSFCMKCGAKVPPIQKVDKKSKKRMKKGKKSKAKIVPAAVLILIVSVSFLVFGGDKVPAPIKDDKVYRQVTETIKDKLPDQVKFPFDLPELPFDLPEIQFKLPFELPSPSKLLGESEIPNNDKIMQDLNDLEGEDGKLNIDSLEIEKRITSKEDKEDTIYLAAKTESETGTAKAYYRLLYKKHFIGGWKLDEAEPYNIKGEETSIAGVDNDIVMEDKNLFADIPSDWKRNEVKVMGHNTDMKEGTDTVLVYMELETGYVNLTATTRIEYQFNEHTKEWTSTGPASKLNCLWIEPAPEQLTGQISFAL